MCFYTSYLIKNILIITLLGLIISLSGCLKITEDGINKSLETKDVTAESNKNLKIGDTAILLDSKLAVTLKQVKRAQNQQKGAGYTIYDKDFMEYSYSNPEDRNVFGLRVQIKNIDDMGIKQDCSPWYAKVIDYAGFEYSSYGYTRLGIYGMYPGDTKETMIVFADIPDRSLDGKVITFAYACGQEATWSISIPESTKSPENFIIYGEN